jgi:hypothetical protein
MGKHTLEEDKADQDSGTFSGDVFDITPVEEKPTRTFESDSGGVQRFEYF